MADRFIPPAIAAIAPDGNLTPRQKRRFLIDMSLRKQKPGTGSSLEFLQRRTADYSYPDLREFLKDIKWAVIGTVATRAYMAERVTQGLDIVVLKEDGERVIQCLVMAGYTVVSELAISGYQLCSSSQSVVNVYFGNQKWLPIALQNLSRDPAGYPVLSLPYLILMKLNAPRIRDWADIPRMLCFASDQQLDAVREVIACYSPDDKDDLEDLIVLGKREKETPTWH